MKRLLITLITIIFLSVVSFAQVPQVTTLDPLTGSQKTQFATQYGAATINFSIAIGETNHQLTYSAPGYSAITVTVKAGTGGSLSTVGTSTTTGAATITWTGTYTQGQLIYSGLTGSGSLDANYFGIISNSVGSVANQIVVGNVASGAADSGAPVKTGGVYNSTQPTFTNAQRGDTQIDSKGNTRVTVCDTNPYCQSVDVNGNAKVIQPSITYNSTQPTLSNGDGTDVQVDSRANLKVTGGTGATFPITAASGAIASGAVASGAFASGALASGSIASGAVAAGAFAVGSIPPAAGTLKGNTPITSAMTGTTSTQLIAGTASNYLYITWCHTSNGSTTVSTDILLQDGSGGTTIDVLPAPAASVASTGGGGGTYVYPTPLKVPTVGNGLYAANVTTGSSTKINCGGFISTTSY